MTLEVEELELNHQSCKANHLGTEHGGMVKETLMSNGSVENNGQINEQQLVVQEACERLNNVEHRALVQTNSQQSLREEIGIIWCFFTFAGMIFYLLDVCSDLYVATDLYITGMLVYFMWTLMFVVTSSLITNTLSLFIYWEAKSNKNAPKASTTEWVIRVVFHVCQLGPVLRYIDTYRYGCSAKSLTLPREESEQRRMFDAMTYERADVALLRLLECFVEAAPQMVLQIFIMVDPAISTSSLIAKFVSCTISLMAMSFSIVSHQRASRSSQYNTELMTWTATFVLFSSYACFILSRVVTFGLFASHSLLALLFICFIHCAIMTTWIFLMKTELAENRWIETVFKFLFGIAYVFCYINLEDNTTRWRQSAFHLLTFCENVALIVVWCLDVGTECKYYVVTLVIGSYISGLILLAIYYKQFHPKRKHIPGISCCWPLPS